MNGKPIELNGEPIEEHDLIKKYIEELKNYLKSFKGKYKFGGNLEDWFQITFIDEQTGKPFVLGFNANPSQATTIFLEHDKKIHILYNGNMQEGKTFFWEKYKGMPYHIPIKKYSNEKYALVGILEDGINDKIKNFLDTVIKIKTGDSNTTGIDESYKKDNIKIDYKNLILFGPPGTGKTFITKEMAVSIIES